MANPSTVWILIGNQVSKTISGRASTKLFHFLPATHGARRVITRLCFSCISFCFAPLFIHLKGRDIKTKTQNCFVFCFNKLKVAKWLSDFRTTAEPLNSFNANGTFPQYIHGQIIAKPSLWNTDGPQEREVKTFWSPPSGKLQYRI